MAVLANPPRPVMGIPTGSHANECRGERRDKVEQFTGVALSSPRPLMVWAMGLASLWCMVALKTATILPLRRGSEKSQVHFITTAPYRSVATTVDNCAASSLLRNVAPNAVALAWVSAPSEAENMRILPGG